MKTSSRRLLYGLSGIIILVAMSVFIEGRDARNAHANAVYILGQNYPDERIEADVQQLVQASVSRTNKALAHYGGQIVDTNAYGNALFEVTFSAFSESRSRSVPFFLTIFTPTELADIAEFYKTEPGQLTLLHGPRPVFEDGEFSHPDDITTWIKNLSQDQLVEVQTFLQSPSGLAWQDSQQSILQFALTLAPGVRATVDEHVNLDRLIDIIEREDIVAFDDPTQREILVRQLRQSQEQ
jgi:hypothetical protein